jgi:hypothetical protein
MAYDIRVGQLFVKGINTQDQVISIIQQAQCQLGKRTTTSWTSEGDGETLEWSLSPDLVISEGIYFLKRYYPDSTKWGQIVTAKRQIRF